MTKNEKVVAVEYSREFKLNFKTEKKILKTLGFRLNRKPLLKLEDIESEINRVFPNTYRDKFYAYLIHEPNRVITDGSINEVIARYNCCYTGDILIIIKSPYIPLYEYNEIQKIIKLFPSKKTEF